MTAATDTIRDELARVLADASDARMGERTGQTVTDADVELADAILSSSVVARIRAEVISEWRAANPGVPIDEHDRQIRAEAWDECMKRAQTIVNNRSGTYEAFIDLAAEPNPYQEATV